MQNILTTLFSLPSSSLNSNQNRSYSIPTSEMQSRYPYSFLTSDLCTRIIEEGNKRGIKVLLTHPDPQKSSRKKRRLSKKIDSQWVRDGNALGACHSEHWAEITLCQHPLGPSQCAFLIKQSDSPCPLLFQIIYEIIHLGFHFFCWLKSIFK